MRNLYRVSHMRNKLAVPDTRSLRETDNIISCVALDQDENNKIYFATGEGLFRVDNLKGGQWEDPDLSELRFEELLPTEENFLNDDKIDAKLRRRYFFFDENPEEWFSTRDEVCRGDIETLLLNNASCKHIIAIEHLPGELCSASSDGNVWCYDLYSGTVKEVAFFQDGIQAMQWDVDQKVVVFVDKKLNVVTMNGSDYTKLNEMQLGYGSDGSDNEDDILEKNIDESDERIEEDPYTCISWQDDGMYFAVSFKAPGESRAFVVFDGSGELKYVSEPCDGLYSALVWQPIGEWIAMPQVKSEGKFVIALFNKYGTRLREIPTPLIRDNHEVLSLHWSPDSSILAVFWYDTNDVQYNNIFLYAYDNDNWYLKQCLVWPGNIYGVQWQPFLLPKNTLHLLTNELCYERISFDFRVDRSMGHGEDDEAMVAVIDGNQLRLTSFRRSIIPAPMCSYTLTLPEEEYINAVGFIRSPGRWASMGEDVTRNAFFVVDSTNKITFYDVAFTGHEEDDGQNANNQNLMVAKHLLSLPPKRDLKDWGVWDSLIHWLWVNPDHVVLCCNTFFVALNLKNPTKAERGHYQWIEEGQTEPFTENETIACVEALGPDSVLVELTSGRLMRVEGFTVGQPGVESFSIKLHSTLPKFCEQLFIDQQHSPADVYAFSQARRNLYRNGTLLASEVTSVFLSEEYLLFTTFDELKFVSLGDKLGAKIVGERRLERGSKLVTVVPKASRTIFQLPRGNLEAISPRVLSLCLIAKHLEALEYHAAFDIMRKERINLNLLVDHDAERFLAHMDTHFLAQITEVSWLNLFITDLADQDVCRTMYESNYPGRQQSAACLPSSSGYTVEGKVQFICERLLGAMDSDPTVLTLPKITCHVKQGQLEKALSLIWTLKRDNPKPEPAEEALHFLHSLVEVNEMHDAALGLYDLKLVQYVLTISKKDAQKYLPFLNKLKRLDEHERKHRIDCHLKRYDRVVVNSSRREADESRLLEVLELIDTYNLYTIGIECYRTGSNGQFLRNIYERYANHLREIRKHVEASMMYERIGDIKQAINSARHALDWRRVLRLSARSTDLEAVRLVLRSLVPALVEAGEHNAAATIAHEQLKDVRLAIECLLKDHRYERALLMVVSGGPDVSELHETIREHLRQYLSSFIVTLATDGEQFLHQKGRLQVARANPEKQTLSTAASDAEKEGSSSNDRSRKWQGSSMNRRKSQRLNPKKENPLDALAPIDVLYALVVRICSIDMQRSVRSMCQVAVELRFDAEAQAIQRDYGALFELFSRSLDFIWIPLLGQAAQPHTLIEPNDPCKPVIQSIDWQLDILK